MKGYNYNDFTQLIDYDLSKMATNHVVQQADAIIFKGGGVQKVLEELNVSSQISHYAA